MYMLQSGRHDNFAASIADSAYARGGRAVRASGIE